MGYFFLDAVNDDQAGGMRRFSQALTVKEMDMLKKLEDNNKQRKIVWTSRVKKASDGKKKGKARVVRQIN